MDKRVFIDFGSTFTKVVVFDLDSETLLARVQSPSTVDTDVNIGLDKALSELHKTGDVTEDEIRAALASRANEMRRRCDDDMATMRELLRA